MESRRGIVVASLNVGTMTGRGREVVDMMKRRKVGILCVQETKWKGSKATVTGTNCTTPAKMGEGMA